MTNIISVIIPIYNTPVNLFEKCIDSLISQQYENLEIILALYGIENKYKNLEDYISLKNKLIHTCDNNILISYNDISNFVIGNNNVEFEHIENNGFMINVEIYNKKDNIQLIISKGNKSNVDLSILEKQIINKWKELK